MTLKTSTLRPGFLVSLKTSVTGNVQYTKRDLEKRKTADGAAKATWETERTIQDPAEHEAAQEARAKASHFVRSVCTHSAFGLLCPETAAEELDRAIASARVVAETFNATAALSRLNVYVMTGRIAPDDVEAVRAINSEVRDLLRDMERGIANLDVVTVRAAASRAKSIGAMLSPDAAARIQIAIDLARESAKKIVKAGDEVGQEIDRQSIKRIAEQRTAFIDLDDVPEVKQVAAQGRAVDMTPAIDMPKKAAKAQARLDME